tara:strand:+ start:2178 stop:3422 length:1245 start_codon:yes stop_codon:yes gene_type:complete
MSSENNMNNTNIENSNDPQENPVSNQTPINDTTPESGDDTTPESGDDTTPESGDDTTPELGDDKSSEDSSTNQLKTITDNLITSSNMFVLIWFLAIYIAVYYILGMFFNKGKEPGEFQQNLGRTLDLIFFISVFIFAISYYTSKTKEQVNEDLMYVYNSILSFLEEPTNLVSTSLFIASLYIIVYLFRIPMAYSSKPLFISLIENSAWISLVLGAIVVFIQKIFDINILDYLRETASKIDEDAKALIDSELPIVPIETDEVFNVSDNKYSYEDAQAVCSSFGSKLATYDQIEAAYNNGAEWCNYGWSDGQMAFFPTQKETWDKLQKFPKKKNNCGRPGINGGFINNPYIKFGVNCYGKKPKPTENDIQRLDAKQTHPIPLTAEDKELQKKIDYWKENSDKLKLNSYNNKNWSRY